MNSCKDSQGLNIQAELSTVFQKFLLPDGWTQSKKADTASWSIPVLQNRKGAHFLVLSDGYFSLTQDSLKFCSARKGKYTANQDLYTHLYANLVAPICEFCK